MKKENSILISRIVGRTRKSELFIYLFLTCCRFINPVVVAPTVTALGLAFFSFGFPQAGACVEISIPEIVLVLIFTLVSISAECTSTNWLGIGYTIFAILFRFFK